MGVGIREVHQSLDYHSLFYCLCSSLNKISLAPKLLPTLDEDPCFLYYPLRHLCYYPLWHLCGLLLLLGQYLKLCKISNICQHILLQIRRQSRLLYFKRCIGVLEASACPTVVLCLKDSYGFGNLFLFETKYHTIILYSDWHASG